MREIVRYKTLDACMKAFGVEGLGHWKWMDADGKLFTMSLKEMKAKSRKRRCWAWVENKETIHLWMGNGCKEETLVRVLAHEMGHMERPFHRGPIEEQKAAKYERVAMDAYRMAKKIRREWK